MRLIRQFIPLFLLLPALVSCSPRPEETEADKERQQQERELIQAYLAEQAESYEEVAPGLWVHIVEAGDSIHPALSSIVTVAYEARGLNGLVVDSASEAKPFRSRLARLIPGWQQSLPLIGQGGTIHLVVSSELAYRTRAIHPDLGAWSPLAFFIQLLKVDLLQP